MTDAPTEEFECTPIFEEALRDLHENAEIAHKHTSDNYALACEELELEPTTGPTESGDNSKAKGRQSNRKRKVPSKRAADDKGSPEASAIGHDAEAEPDETQDA